VQFSKHKIIPIFIVSFFIFELISAYTFYGYKKEERAKINERIFS